MTKLKNIFSMNSVVCEYIERPFVPEDAYCVFEFDDLSVIECLRDEIPYWILKKKYKNIMNCSTGERYILKFFLNNQERV